MIVYVYFSSVRRQFPTLSARPSARRKWHARLCGRRRRRRNRFRIVQNCRSHALDNGTITITPHALPGSTSHKRVPCSRRLRRYTALKSIPIRVLLLCSRFSLPFFEEPLQKCNTARAWRFLHGHVFLDPFSTTHHTFSLVVRVPHRTNYIVIIVRACASEPEREGRIHALMGTGGLGSLSRYYKIARRVRSCRVNAYGAVCRTAIAERAQPKTRQLVIGLGLVVDTKLAWRQLWGYLGLRSIKWVGLETILATTRIDCSPIIRWWKTPSADRSRVIRKDARPTWYPGTRVNLLYVCQHPRGR